MKRSTCLASLLLVSCPFTSMAVAGVYDFEIGLGYASGEFDGSQTITTNGGTVFNSVSSDTDDVNVFGSWFFSGLSDDKGPRARAVFVDRASALNISYSRSDRSVSTILTSDDPAFPLPPIDTTVDTKGDTYGADVRYVHRDSGWTGVAGLSTTRAKFGGIVSGNADATAWRLGFGKYVLENTFLGVDVSQADADGGNESTAYNVALEHLGDLGGSWQYAVDLRYSTVDSNGVVEVDTLRGAFSLYPNRDLEFGIAIEDASGGAQDFLGFEGYASWFVSPGFRVSAGYRVDDVDFLGNVFIGGTPGVSSADQKSFRVGASVRF